MWKISTHKIYHILRLFDQSSQGLRGFHQPKHTGFTNYLHYSNETHYCVIFHCEIKSLLNFSSRFQLHLILPMVALLSVEAVTNCNLPMVSLLSVEAITNCNLPLVALLSVEAITNYETRLTKCLLQQLFGLYYLISKWWTNTYSKHFDAVFIAYDTFFSEILTLYLFSALFCVQI